MEHTTNNKIKGLTMNILITKIKMAFRTKPSNAVLLLLTGFFFTLSMLSNVLHTMHPHGGWMTSIGTFTTRSILMTSLFVLSLCLIALWRSAAKTTTTKRPQQQLSIPEYMLTSA